jgi:peptide deformylase
MAKVLPVIVAPHKLLAQTCAPLKGVDAGVRTTLDNMLATLYAADGAAIAAPQVGILERVVVMDLGEAKPDGKRDYQVKKPEFLINPEIVWRSDETKPYQEGCLSIPGIYAEVQRPAQVRVRYLDREGELREVAWDGLHAVVIQHEIDHLDGVLFTKHLSRLQRGRMEKKYQKSLPEWLEHARYDVMREGQGLVPANPAEM